MKVLVTGASGFVGRAVTRAAPPAVTILAVGRTGSPAPLVETVQVSDVTDADWRPILKGVDAVIHLAGMAHQVGSTGASSLAEYRRVNVEGTRGIATAAARAGVARFVFVSSIKVHGEATFGEPLRPESPIRPADPYGQSKAEAEDVVRRAADGASMRFVIVRPPLVYGPGVRANFLSLVSLVDRRIPLPFGSIRNRRSLVSVSNLADLLLRAATVETGRDHTLLVADGPPISTPFLVRSIAECLNRPGWLLPAPPNLLRVAARFGIARNALERLLGSLEVDASATQRELGWSPPASFREGIVATCNWFTKEHRRPRTSRW